MNCPVCGHSQTSYLGTIDRFEPAFDIWICSHCGSRFRNPVPHNPNEYYEEEYYSGKAEFSYIDEREQYRGFKHVYCSRLATISAHALSGKFLDVGCSFGGLVYCASSRFESYGLDVSTHAIEKGIEWIAAFPPKKFPARLYRGSLEDLPVEQPFEEGSFSVITMIEVAEHLANPRSVFAEAARLLKPGGLLVVQTANFIGLQAEQQGLNYHYFLPGHLVYYTNTGLKQLLSQSGFSSFREYFPVDFSLWAKLRKYAHGRNLLSVLSGIFRITWYHLKSKIRKNGKPLTSSYVLYAYKSNYVDG